MADTDLIERATKAIDLFDAICNIHDPSVSAQDRRVRAMAKVLEAAPSPSPAPGVVIEALNKIAEVDFEQSKSELHDYVTDIALSALASLSQPAKGEHP